jgi:hypothetical protein
MNRLPQPPKVINPLWIIFLFFSFTEVALGFVVFKTTGGIQLALTCFVISFPLLVAAAFFALLWNRPGNLYAPKDFVNDESFLKSIADVRKGREGLLNLDAKIEQRINAKLTSEQLVKSLSTLSVAQLKEALEVTAADISQDIREATFISVSLERVSPKLEGLILPVDAFSNFDELTDEVYFAMKGAVSAFSYGTSWILRDKASGKRFKHARMIAGLGPGRLVNDNRTLEEVGIKAGMFLEAILFKKEDTPAA